MRRQRLALAHLVGALTISTPLLAQDVATAEALFNRGLADMQAGRLDAGCPALSESYRLDPRPGTLFTVAECEAKRGRIATAATRYGDYLALFARLPPDAQAHQKGRDKIAAQKRAALAPDIPEVTLELPPGAPAGTTVERDGVELGNASLGMPLPIDPGEHVVATQAPGGPRTELRFTIAKGEKKQLPLKVEAAPAAQQPAPATPPPAEAAPFTPASSAPAPADAPPSTGQRTAAIVVGGLGGAGLVLGGVMGGLALGKKSIVDDNCVGPRCNHEGKAAADAGKTFALVSTIGFGVGVAGLGTMALLLLTDPSSPKPTEGRARPRGAALSRVDPDVTLGPDGAAVGVKGVW